MCLPATFLRAKYAIKYAYMPNRKAPVHSWMAQLPAALRARMDVEGHTQKDVEDATGVPQPQISRVLNGRRKRPTDAMRKLCLYADLKTTGEALSGSAELSGLLQQVIAGGPQATACVTGILKSLMPLLENPTQRKRKR